MLFVFWQFRDLGAMHARWLRDPTRASAQYITDIIDPCTEDPDKFRAMLKRIYWAVKRKAEQTPDVFWRRAVHLGGLRGQACREASAE